MDQFMMLIEQFNAMNNSIDNIDVNIIRQNLGLPSSMASSPEPYFIQVINQVLAKQNLSLDLLEQLPDLVQQGMIASFSQEDKNLVQQALEMQQSMSFQNEMPLQQMKPTG